MLKKIYGAALYLAMFSAVSAFAGQGAQRMLYTTPNMTNLMARPPGTESVITVADSSGSIATLQASINSARSANPTNVIVISLKSNAVYSVSSASLMLDSRECLIAANATIQAANSSVTVPLVQITSGATNVSVAGGTLDGNGANIQGIYAPAAKRVNVDMVTVKNCGQDCILLKGQGNSTYDNEMSVTRCDVSESPAHAGISIQNSTQTVVTDNNCHNNSVGIYLSCAWATVANNTCHHNTTGIDIAGGNDNVVANNTCDNNGTGIHAGASNNMITSNSAGNNSTAGMNSNGSGNTFVDNLFTSGNAANFISSGSGNNVMAYKAPLSASGQNYFYPPLIDNQHTDTIVNGMGRTDLTIASTTIDSVQSQYNSARSSNPNNVIVLHLNGTFTVGSSPLTLESNTCVLLNGTIQINGSTGASSAVHDGTSAKRISISGGVIDGSNLTGNNGISFSGASMAQIDAVTVRNFGPENPRSGGSDSIHLANGSTPYVVTRCYITNSSSRGMWLQLSGKKSVISDNEVTAVNQDGVDCDSSTSGAVVKFNYCHDLTRYGVFIEQSASHNSAFGNICNNTGRDINLYNNYATYRAPVQYNTVACNWCYGNNGIRNGSTGTNTTITAHNFLFNNTVISASINSENEGTENYYSQNYQASGSLSTAGTEAFFNSVGVSSNLYVLDGNSGLPTLVQGASTANGAAIVTGSASGLDNDKWALIPVDSGYYRITNKKSKSVMAVSGASTSPGASIVQWAFGSGKNDQWMPMSAGNGLYYFVNRLSGLCLDVTGGSGTQLDQQPYTGGANQQFAISINVNAITPSPFSLSAAPAEQSVAGGSQTNYTITLTTNATFVPPVTFVLSGLPTNCAAGFSPASLSTNGNSILTITTSNNTPGGNYVLTVSGNSSAGTNSVSVALTVVGAGSNLVWNSTSSTVWDTTTANWFNQVTGTNDLFQNGKNVIFTDGSGLATGITIASGVTVNPASITVNADNNNYTISGAGKISGITGLNKSGAGTLTLNTSNNFTGIVTISGGTISTPLFDNSTAGGLGSGSSPVVLDGGTLKWTGSSSALAGRGFMLTQNGGALDSSPPASANLTLTGTISFSNSGDRLFILSGTDPNPLNIGGNAISSVIADGSGGVTTIEKDGNNAWNLSGANTYSGGTLINSGRLRANTSASAFGTGPVTVADGAQAYLNVASALPNPFIITGIGIPETGGNYYGALRLAVNGCIISNTVTLAGNARITARGATGSGATISGQIIGDTDLELGGASGNGAIITENITASDNAYVLRSSADSDQDESQTLVNKRVNDSNARLAYVRFNLASFLSQYSTNDVTAITLRLYLAGSSFTDAVNVYGLQDTNLNGVSDSVWTSAMTWNNQPAKTASPNDIPGSSSALPNANTTALLGSQSFATTPGEVDITLSLSDFLALLGKDSNQQVTLLFVNTTQNAIPSWASLANTSGYLAPTLQITVSPNGVGGTSGVLTLANGNNNWSGNTTISHGTVKLAAANAIPHGVDGGNVTINNSSPVNPSLLDLNGVSTALNGLSSSGDDLTLCIVTNGSVTTATLTIGDNDAGGTFGGVIKNGAGIVALTKTGAGTEILSGANSYTGNTVINGGALVVNGSLANSAVTVQNGATLGGSGVLNGSVAVNSGGTIAPVGILTVNNSVTLQGTTFMELNQSLATNDVIGGATIIHFRGTLSLTNLSGSLAINDSYKLFSANNYSGAFTGIIPATPGANLAWDTNSLATDGTLKIVSAIVPTPHITGISLNGTTLTISGTNGADNGQFVLLGSTNVALPLNLWTPLLTNTFDGNGNFNLTTNIINPNNVQQFYRLQSQ